MGGVVDSLFGGTKVPDPNQVAGAQSQANIDAARVTAGLNRPDQYTPWGNLTWKNQGGQFDQAGYDAAYKTYQDALNQYNAAQPGVSGAEAGPFDQQARGTAPVAPDRKDFTTQSDKWVSTIELDPRLQSILDTQWANQQKLANTAGKTADAVQSALGAPIDTSGLTQRMSVADALSAAGGSMYDPTRNVQQAAGLAGMAGKNAASAANRFGQLSPLSFQGAPQSPDASNNAWKNVEDALYARQTSRLDPQFQQASSDLASQLAAKGITQGSAAYDREMQNFGRTRNDAYENARNASIAAGNQAMNDQFVRQLQARQQGVNEQTTLHNSGLTDYTTAINAANATNAGLAGLGGYDISQANAIPTVAGNLWNLSDTARRNELTEQMQLRSQLLNEMSALQNGSQVQMPQFGSGQSGANVSSVPVGQYMYDSYNGQTGANNNAMSGMMGLLNLGAKFLL